MEVSEDIIVYGFMYCLTRKSYVVGDFTHEIIPKLPQMSIGNKNYMKRMIDVAIDNSNIGLDIDKAEWIRFRAALDA